MTSPPAPPGDPSAEPPAAPPRRYVLRAALPGLTDEKIAKALAYTRLYAAYTVGLIFLLSLGMCMRGALY